MESMNNDLHDNMIASGRNFSGDYNGLSLRSMKLKNCTFNGAIFSDAAVTGSKFEECDFNGCEMDQGDFEYSEFFDCSFTSKHPISISFNNSNFINTRITDIDFVSSTFTNAFFDGVTFSGGTINNCTLEAVSFYHCQFHGTALTNLNLDFSEFVDPDFHDCVFPQAQVLNTFGLLQYMMSANVPIKLGDHAGNVIMDSDIYINKKLPQILQNYSESDSINMYGKYFAIINILLAYKKKEEATYYLEKAFEEAALIEDLRMVRYYCKLISFCELYSSGERRKLYHDICNYFHMDIMAPWKLKNYSRQIGEIRYTLLNENNLPTLIYYAVTNLVGQCLDKIGTVMKHVFALADKYNGSPMHDIRVEITRNSPLQFTIYFTETIENIAAMFRDLMALSQALEMKNESRNKISVSHKITNELQQYIKEYSEIGIRFRYIGSQIENWKPEYNNVLQIEG
ncbi:MAG: pentapeptide repeat-containing protein [Lachnospiraceae bacterium]|nr:pentapeptide repeat-containing protein [Lachnospiraceae bacterium]